MDTNYPSLHPELWGGLECTINRVGDHYRDQLFYADHFKRKDDLEKIASLGIKKLRYPILWEAHEQKEGQAIDWENTRTQLNKMRSLNIAPIAGLVHHGSGPLFTHLLDDRFGERLAAYAEKVATEFPWINDFTPVNEPLTTARFSGLYGHWYPHHKNDESFCRIFLNQVKGIVLAMKAIRRINPGARLIQTEDLAKIHSTRKLAYQARFENQRRWLTYDVLCGKFNREHPLWEYFLAANIEEEELTFFLENPCVPDIVGFNYYITSERFLDENISVHPAEHYGGNERHQYADVAAVRVRKPAGLRHLLMEAWERYGLPLALTEVHMNCTREEQMRWFTEAWKTCSLLVKKGIDVRGVTAWALLGSFDWTSLLVREEKQYETGVFDLSGNQLRPTAMTKLLRGISGNSAFDHPVLKEKGWWHRSFPTSRHLFTNKKSAKPLLIFGCQGTLGSAFAKTCLKRSIYHVALSRSEADITNIAQIESLIKKYDPWAIVNASGYVRVDEAETDSAKCFLLNSIAPANLARICKRYGIQLVNFSTDLVFDGKKTLPYGEGDQVKPLNVYGRSKAEGEQHLLDFYGDSLVVRTSSFFGPWDKYNFAFHALETLALDRDFPAVDDIVVSPTYVPHLADTTLDLLIDGEKGIWHLTNEGHITWYEFARELASRKGFSPAKIISSAQADMRWPAARPAYSAMHCTRGIRLPSLERAIEQYIHEKIC